MSLRVTDVFCGKGGWSDGFAAQGFKCTGIDIEYSLAPLQPGNPVDVLEQPDRTSAQASSQG